MKKKQAIIERLETWRKNAEHNAVVMARLGKTERQEFYLGQAYAYYDTIKLLKQT